MTQIIDQDKAKRLLAAISPAHVLLIGPPGSGKTTLGLVYLHQFGRPLIVSGAEARQYQSTIERYKGPVLVDEAHRLQVPELLYPLLDLALTRRGSRTFAFATTDEGELPGPLLSRLVPVILEPYSNAELAQIAELTAPSLSDGVRAELARCARGSPRRVKLLAKLVSNLGGSALRPHLVKTALSLVGYPQGLSFRELSLMVELARGPRSATTLAGLLGTSISTIRSVETELVRAGLVVITNKGRALTSKGFEVLQQLLQEDPR